MGPFDPPLAVFAKSDDWRTAAEEYERLADAARLDGDHAYARLAANNAARCRERARVAEIRGPSQ
jgi:hypothetical protein